MKEIINGSNDYSKIKNEYLELLEQVKTTQAKQDINWKIAQLNFKFLNNKDDAVQRMLELTKQIKLDSTKRAVEERCQKYFEDFGLMCYNLGNIYLKSNQYKNAIIYFFQSVKFNWSGIGKSYLKLTTLSTLDNNSVLHYGNKALFYKDQLNNSELFNLYYLMYDAYKRLGNFSVANSWYQKTTTISMEQ